VKPSRTRATKGPRAKSTARDRLDDLIVASARALALPIDPAWTPAIKFNLEVILRLAGSFADFPLPDDAEPAPVFVA
jgi:hypothetical protein